MNASRALVQYDHVVVSSHLALETQSGRPPGYLVNPSLKVKQV
jgi:hypothetical protein